MNKIILNVPRGIRYLSDWEGFSLPVEPSIINKQITGCGFTEWCIKSEINLILCSPRIVLLENKEEQHPGEVFYARNELDTELDVGKDLSTNKPKLPKEDKSLTQLELDQVKESVQRFKDNIYINYFNCSQLGKPCKILVTYDSFKHVKESLGRTIENFYIVVDEFQSIFTDSKFKSSTELEFINHLQGLNKISFVSATPMMDEYLDMLPEFKNLSYYELDWGKEDPGRIVKPQLSIKPSNRILEEASRIIKTYQEGNFQKYTYTDDLGNFQEIESKELVIYVNSVKNICDLIRKNGLTLENTNVLCSKTPENNKKLKSAFEITSKGISCIGKVPKRGEQHKMFTLCTRTVYLGADFYSTCARSLILSDANIDCLSVDITLDLPQILGRQRLLENPWKNRAELYFKPLSESRSMTGEDFKNRINEKRSKTEELLSAYSTAIGNSVKHTLAETYQKLVKTFNYRDNYIAVNTHTGKDLLPVINNLVMVSEIRAFQIQQIDYKDRFTVFRTIDQEICNDEEVIKFLREFDSLVYFTDKMKLLCKCELDQVQIENILEQIPINFKNYYNTIGPERIRNLQYKNSVIQEEYERLKNNQGVGCNLDKAICDAFFIGNKYLKTEIKLKLKEIYSELSILGNPKASDLEKYFELREVNITDPSTGKRVKGYELLKIKE